MRYFLTGLHMNSVFTLFFNKLTCEIFHTQFYLQVLACDMKIKCMKMLKTFEKKTPNTGVKYKMRF